MCGRYTRRVSPAELAEIFGVLNSIQWSPRYNIAPTQTVVAVRDSDQREFFTPKWGLIPSWAKDAKIAKEEPRSWRGRILPVCSPCGRAFRASFRRCGWAPTSPRQTGAPEFDTRHFGWLQG